MCVRNRNRQTMARHIASGAVGTARVGPQPFVPCDSRRHAGHSLGGPTAGSHAHATACLRCCVCVTHLVPLVRRQRIAIVRAARNDWHPSPPIPNAHGASHTYFRAKSMNPSKRPNTCTRTDGTRGTHIRVMNDAACIDAVDSAELLRNPTYCTGNPTLSSCAIPLTVRAIPLTAPAQSHLLYG